MLRFAAFCAMALAVGLVIATALPAAAEGVIKGGTVVIAPGTQVEGLDNIRQGADGSTIAVDCPGGRTLALATGSGKGSCEATTGSTGDVESARCDDGANAAVGVCALENGAGACSVTIGSGTCQAE